MKYPLKFHPHVEEDLDAAYNWYEDKQKNLGERFLSELSECYIQLAEHPEYYGRVTEQYRRLVLPHFPYIIAFEIVMKTVYVYSIFHTSRNPQEIVNRKNTAED